MPAIVSTDTFDRVARRLDDNKRFAARNSKVPSLLQGLAACAGCGYGYYRTSTRTTNKTIYYYRCLGSDDYRYEGGRVCANKPVRADYLDQVVWDHITGLLADPQLIRAEIDKRLDAARTADPVARQRKSLDSALAKTATSIARMIEAYGEQLITIDELRARMPDLRARETNLRNQIHALDAQLADRKAYLTLAADLEGFLAQLHTNAEVSTVQQRQRVLRLLVKDVLIGPDKITIRHRIPIRERITGDAERADSSDLEDDHQPHCPLRWRGDRRPLRGPAGCPDPAAAGCRRAATPARATTGAHTAAPRQIGDRATAPSARGPRARCRRTCGCPNRSPSRSSSSAAGTPYRIQRRTPRAIAIGIVMEDLRDPRHQLLGHHRLRHAVRDRGDGYFILPFLQSRVGIGSYWWLKPGRSIFSAVHDAGVAVIVGSHSAWRRGFGVAGRGLQVSGFGYAATAFDLDVLGPGDAEPVAGSASGGEFAGLDPVVDGAGVEPSRSAVSATLISPSV